MVDPVYEVNPLTAVVDLVTTLVLHPLSRWCFFWFFDVYDDDLPIIIVYWLKAYAFSLQWHAHTQKAKRWYLKLELGLANAFTDLL